MTENRVLRESGGQNDHIDAKILSASNPKYSRALSNTTSIPARFPALRVLSTPMLASPSSAPNVGRTLSFTLNDTNRPNGTSHTQMTKYARNCDRGRPEKELSVVGGGEKSVHDGLQRVACSQHEH